ncbi:MAG: hypothetical protein AMJ54_07755 [Deltaproteobacteria bacterium SG8_13]|nr:MAG: hypothetical protein AMJ54_07755 [Deltaproteobacteria bacterium SG8_13]
MVQKVYISSSKMVTFTCPQCEYPRVVNVAQHKELETVDRVKVKCKRCGHRYLVVIERRGQYRKVVDLPGTFTLLVDGRPTDKGYMKVVDLSRSGLKIKLNDNPAYAVGDRLMIEFHLDDTNRSLIRKEVEIKKIFGQELGVAFTSVHASDPSDKALGFYMFG